MLRLLGAGVCAVAALALFGAAWLLAHARRAVRKAEKHTLYWAARAMERGQRFVREARNG